MFPTLRNAYAVSHTAEMMDDEGIAKLPSHLSVLESIGDAPEVRTTGPNLDVDGDLSINAPPGAGERAFSDAMQG